AVPGQITASRSFFEAIANLDTAYGKLFEHLGAPDDKHGRTHELYAVSRSDTVLEKLKADLAAEVAEGPDSEKSSGGGGAGEAAGGDGSGEGRDREPAGRHCAHREASIDDRDRAAGAGRHCVSLLFHEPARGGTAGRADNARAGQASARISEAGVRIG